MSLDVYLYTRKKQVCLECGISSMQDINSFDCNITHNLNRMAEAAGIYQHLWRPEELGIKKAGDLIKPLREGLKKLLDDPNKYKKFNPENGWGCYENLVEFVSLYLEACKSNPSHKVRVSR